MSNNSKLILHCGAETVGREVVDAVPTPEPSQSKHGRWYVPVGHSEVINSVERSLNDVGVSVAEQHFALTKEGNRLFGLLTLGSDDGSDHALTVGIRNSHDKRFPVGLSLGSRVFVCDNLSFAGESVVRTLHTRFVRDRLPGVVGEAVAGLVAHRGQLEKRIALYKETPVENHRHLHDLVIRGFKARAIPAQAISQVVREFEEPRHPEFQDWSLWSCFNAFTEVLKNYGEIVPRTHRLHGVFDAEVGAKLLAV